MMLLEHLGVVASTVRHILIDCLSNVVHNLMMSSNFEAAIINGMRTIGEAIRMLVAQSHGLRIYFAQPIPPCVIALVSVQ